MDDVFPLDPPPGFRGLDPFKPINCYRRHLPHWRQKGATYFVTFRLADSIPTTKLVELRQLRREWERDLAALERDRGQLPKRECDEAWERLARTTFERVETWLDQGMGSCLLRESPVRLIVADALHYVHDRSCELGCHVIMPNHVHAIVRPMGDDSLESVLHCVKRNASRQVNALRGTRGTLWQEESFDRIVRDADHLWRCLQYVGRNPQKADLAEGSFTRWINPAWEAHGWVFDD